MNRFYERNAQVLKQNQPVLFQRLEKGAGAQPAFEIDISPEGATWRSGGREGLLPHRSQAGLDAIVPEKKLYFSYGLGDGEFLRRVLEKEAVHHLVVFEPSPDFFKSVLATLDLRDVLADPRLYFIVGSDEKRYLSDLETCFETQALRYYASGHFGNLITPGAEKIPGSQDRFIKFAEAVPVAIRNYTNKIKSRPTEDNFRGFINAVKNLRSFPRYKPISRFAGLLSDIPCVLVGTGPSLKASIGFLKQVQDRVAIMACDSALNILLREGIEPHFVACLERVPWQKEVMTDLPADLRPVLIAPNIVHPDVFDNYPGRKIGIHRVVGPDEWLFPEEPRYFLGSFVGHAGLAALAALGCRDAYLLGIDSAYGPEAPDANGKRQTYYEGATGAMIKNIAVQDIAWANSLFDMPGYDGTMRRTTYHWYTATFYYGQIARQHDMDLKNVMPVTHGIPIPDASRVDPEAFLRETDARPTAKLRDRIAAAWDKAAPYDFSADEAIRDANAFLKRLRETALREIDRIGQFWFDNDPILPRHIPNFPAFFASVEEARYKLMTDPSGLFMRIMVPLILNDHALTEHELTRAHAEHAQPHRRLNRQVELYLDWYKNLLYWAERLETLIAREAG